MDNCLRGSHQGDFYHRYRFARDSRITLCAGCHDKPPIPLYYSELSIRTSARYSLVLSPDGGFQPSALRQGSLEISSITTDVGRERLEYRLQPAVLGVPTLPAEAGTLNAPLRWL